jgi:hypothetical protein
MVRLETKTMMKRLKSNKTSNARFSGAKIKIADKYWAKAIIGML